MKWRYEAMLLGQRLGRLCRQEEAQKAFTFDGGGLGGADHRLDLTHLGHELEDHGQLVAVALLTPAQRRCDLIGKQGKRDPCDKSVAEKARNLRFWGPRDRDSRSGLRQLPDGLGCLPLQSGGQDVESGPGRQGVQIRKGLAPTVRIVRDFNKSSDFHVRHRRRCAVKAETRNTTRSLFLWMRQGTQVGNTTAVQVRSFQ